MGVLRRVSAERLDELEVLGRVHQVVFAADHVRDVHFQVVHHIDEMEDITSIGAFDDHVGRVRKVAVIDGHFTADEVVHGDGLALEAEAPGTVVLINAAGVGEFLEPRVVDGLALALEIRPAGAVLAGAFVPVEAEPAHAVEDRLAGFLGVAGLVGVLDAQDERAAMFAGEEPVEERGACAADVEVAGWRRGEAGADGHACGLGADGCGVHSICGGGAWPGGGMARG